MVRNRDKLHLWLRRTQTKITDRGYAWPLAIYGGRCVARAAAVHGGSELALVGVVGICG